MFDSWSLFCAHSNASCCAIGGTLVVHSLRLTPHIASHCTPLAAHIVHLQCLSLSPVYLPAWKRSFLRDCLISELSHLPISLAVSNSARLPHFPMLKPKTKDFCETSFKKESWVQNWQPRINAFCDFPTPPFQSTAPSTKNWYHVKRSTAPAPQNHLAILQSWCSEMQPWKSAPQGCFFFGNLNFQNNISLPIPCFLFIYVIGNLTFNFFFDRFTKSKPILIQKLFEYSLHVQYI